MKNSVKIIFLAIFLLAAFPAFSQSLNTDTLNAATDSFADSLSFYSTVGLNWSDAYIGQLPHFGVGVSLGGITIAKDIPLGASFFEGIGSILPAWTVEFRVGGFKIPIDIGLKIGILSPELSKSIIDGIYPDSGFSFDYFLLGGEIRYALIDKKVFPIKVSVGLGVNYLKGGVSTANSGIQFNNDNVSELEIQWNTWNFELNAQVSFPFLIITPYLGVGGSFSMTKTTFEISYNSIKEDFSFSPNRLNLRAFGGFSINMVVVRFDLTGMYNILNGSLGATAGLRFQL